MYNILIFFLFIIHPIYISTSEIILNNNNAEVKIRIFRDDLEDGLRLFHGKSISIDTNQKLKKESKEIDTYIQNKFKLSIDKSKINISIINYQLINDLVEISFSFKSELRIDNISVTNNILFDVYRVQKNVILINFENQTKSHIFSFSDREKTFTY
tara:strand:+ start:970 stop:1437 length:468 start_codon:yes stop_codon:yes gene_type:complete